MQNAHTPTRFVDCEAWRKEISLDEIVPTWDYPEKAQLAQYYKQFYHKIDNVSGNKGGTQKFEVACRR